MAKKLYLFSLIFIFFLAKNSCSYAGDGISLIRDAQAEKFLRELTSPIFIAAGLNDKNIKIYIVNDQTINAFVSGGQNVFINTGLISKFSTPDALIGVIAHESGHIAAGHLARSGEGSQEAQNAMFLSYLLGIGAVLGGSPDAGMALIAGGSQSAQRLYMKFTRTQEEAADNHAVNYLDKMQYPADGLVDLLQSFESEMIGYKDQIDEYLLSHPISKKRIDLIKTRTADKKFSDKKINQKLQPQMDIVLAKIEAYFENPDESLKKYKNQNDERSNYIKSIAFSRKGKLAESIQLLDEIIDKKTAAAFQKKSKKTKSDNSELGFLFELKGQILFEGGRIQDSIVAYNQALNLLALQDSALAKVSFASSILTLKTTDKDLIKIAIKSLESAQEFESENPFLFKQLATAYSKIDEEGKSFLALAEFNLLIGQKEKCRKYAEDAKKKLDKSDKANLLRADDLLELAKEEKTDKEPKDLTTPYSARSRN